MANVSVIGAGSWGLALARRLCKNGHDVTVWSHREEGVRELREPVSYTHLTLPTT